MTKHFQQEFKDQIVELFRKGGRTFMDLGKEFDLSPTTVAHWVRAAEEADPAGAAARKAARYAPREEEPRPLSDREEIARLKRKLAQKEEELEILGKALAFFARRTDQ